MGIKGLIEKDISEAVQKAGLLSDRPVVVEYATDYKFGDYTTTWPLQVARDLDHSSLEIAKKVQEGIKKSEVYEHPEIVEPGFLNFHLKPEFLGKHLKLAVAEDRKFGSSTTGKGQVVLIEYSSPNIAKPMHIGHLRNTNIGQSLVELFRFTGHKVTSDNHIGDWGTQFGKLLYAYKTWGEGLSNPTITDLLELYVRFHKEAEANPELDQAARDEFRKLEQGDNQNRNLWQKFKDSSSLEFRRVYKLLHVEFDMEYGESFYEGEVGKVVDWVLQSGVGKKDPDGSVVIPLEGMPPFLILKSDGATLYGSRDLATAKYRIQKYHPTKVVYVVGAEQSLYFSQLFASLDKLGWSKGVDWVHVSYGLTRLPEGKMSTRSGELVAATEIIAEAESRAQRVLEEKNSKLTNSKDLAREIAVGAIKWADLKVSRESEVVFDWERVFSLEGNSGPYLQYTYARTQNILSKASAVDKSPDFKTELLSDPLEVVILRQLVRFPEVVEASVKHYSPHFVATFGFELAQNFSRFYETIPVLTAPTDLRQARLGLVKAVGIAIRNSLSLLAITAPEKI